MEKIGPVSLSIAKCVSQGLSEYYVLITAVDSVGAIASVDVTIPNQYDTAGPTPVDTSDTSDESGGLPSLSVFATIASMLGAAILLKKE